MESSNEETLQERSIDELDITYIPIPAELLPSSPTGVASSVPVDVNVDSKPESSSLSPEISHLRGNTAWMPVHQDADLYNMNHRYRGRCVVFTQESFQTTGYDDRSASIVDTMRIRETFENLGFTVDTYVNFKYDELIEKLKQLSGDNYEEADCICIFVLTHGTIDDIFWTQDLPFTADEVWKPFTGDKCKSLAGKPKLFFFQACRGRERRARLEGLSAQSGVSGTETDRCNTFYKIPTHADFLIVHSSSQGFYSFRNATTGTHFVRILCEVLNEYADTTDLLKMMTITADKIAYIEAKYYGVGPYEHNEHQVPNITSMLIRDVYFTPKE